MTTGIAHEPTLLGNPTALVARCVGSGAMPKHYRPGHTRGCCQYCGRVLKLSLRGLMRPHLPPDPAYRHPEEVRI